MAAPERTARSAERGGGLRLAGSTTRYDLGEVGDTMERPKRANDVEVVVRIPRDLLGSVVREQLTIALAETLPQVLGQLGERRPPRAAPAAEQDDGPVYLSRRRAAEITGYSLRTISRMIDDGRLRACGPNRDRITRFEIDRMMAKEAERTTAVKDGDLDAETSAQLEKTLDEVE